MKKIKELREEKGLSQAQLAELADVKQATISRYESGARGLQRINVDEITRVANALDVEPWALLEWGDVSSAEVSIMVVGRAELGVWIDNPFFENKERYSVRLPKDERFKGIERKAVELGMSHGYAEGTLAVYINVSSRPQLIENSRRYLVQRQNDAGLYELSIRRLIEDQDEQKWLIAENVAPQHMAPIPYHPDSPTVKLLGRIILTTNPE